MSSRETEDPFLADLLEAGGDFDTFDRVIPATPGPALPPDHKTGLLSKARHEGRFARFAAEVSTLLDLPEHRVSALLDRMADPTVWSRDIPVGEAYWLPGGPRVKDAVRGFVRIAAGSTFPDHEHLGEETQLVLQGSFIDEATGIEYRPGERSVRPAGSAHRITVPAAGVDLLTLVVTFHGYRVGADILLPREVD